MSLEQLPTELFRRVLHALIARIGIPSTWRLRSVSKTFAAAIADELETIYHMKEFDIRTYRCKVGKAGLGDFLAERTMSGSDVHPDIPTALMDTARYLSSFGSIDGTEEQIIIQRSIIQHLCNVLATQYEGRVSETIYILGNGYVDTTPSLQTSLPNIEVLVDRMAGAVIIGDRAALQNCLNGGVDMWSISRTFGSILALAASHGTYSTLQLLLNHLPGKIRSSHPYFAQIHDVFYRSVLAAYQAQKIPIATLLVGWYGNFVSKIPKDYFKDLVTHAILSKSVFAVRATMEIANGRFYKVQWKHFEDAVLGGTPAVLRVILPYFREDSEFYWGRRSPIEFVVKYSQPCFLKEVLHWDELGDDLYGSWRRDVDMALLIAEEYKKEDMACMLREYKAKAVDSGVLPRR